MEIRSAIEELLLFPVNLDHHNHNHNIPIKPFLSLCNLVLQVLDKIGPKMAVLRRDIHHNILRLEKLYDSDPSIYWDVVEMLKKEQLVNDHNTAARKGHTCCSSAFLWLTRSLDFIVALLQLLVKDLGRNIEAAVEESYNITLRPWHGWITSAAYKVALKLVPDNRTLVNILKVDKDEDDHEMLKKDLQNLISLLLPVLHQNKQILIMYGLDKLKST